METEGFAHPGSTFVLFRKVLIREYLGDDEGGKGAPNAEGRGEWELRERSCHRLTIGKTLLNDNVSNWSVHQVLRVYFYSLVFMYLYFCLKCTRRQIIFLERLQ